MSDKSSVFFLSEGSVGATLGQTPEIPKIPMAQLGDKQCGSSNGGKCNCASPSKPKDPAHKCSGNCKKNLANLTP